MRFLSLVAAATLCLAQGRRPPSPEQLEIQIWADIKRELLKPTGPQYFESNLKDSSMPRFHGTVVSGTFSKPDAVLFVRVIGATDAEVKLVFGNNPTSPIFRPGDQIEFEGVPQSFTQKPFLVTMDAKIVGVPVPK
ncbi:MAG TPA: hypothetical protein VN841_11690 [Bryobacteraceae bacterium]|nr:hypothetical protein [Bryobacteraceae bacterium]